MTNEKLANNAVATRNIQDMAVTTAKLANNAVTNEKLANNAVATRNIQDSAVTTVKIQNRAVTMNKLGADVIERFDDIDDYLSDLDSAIAMTTAVANIPGLIGDQKFAVGFGTGFYNGERAGAMKFSFRPETHQNLQLGGSIAYSSRNETTVGFGASFGF